MAVRIHRPVVDDEGCRHCDLCRLQCPELAITKDPETGTIVIDLAYCKGCGICSALCPTGAITLHLEE